MVTTALFQLVAALGTIGSASAAPMVSALAPAEMATKVEIAIPLAYESGIGAPLPHVSGIGAPLPHVSGIGSPPPHVSGIGAPPPYVSGIGAPPPYVSAIGARSASDQQAVGNSTSSADLGRRAESVNYHNSFAPDIVFPFTYEGRTVLAGQRGDQENYGKTQICVPTLVDTNRADKPVYMSCIQWKKKLTVDIKRIGKHAIDCKNSQTTTEITVSDTERNKVWFNLEASGTYGFLSAKLGMGGEHEETHVKSEKTTVSCGDSKVFKCNVGGRALTEINVMEGWVGTLEGVENDPSHPLGARPKWPGMDNQDNFGMDGMTYVSHFSYNIDDYPSTWDTWPATDNDCGVNDSAYYMDDQ